MPKPERIFLVRHGESEGNADRTVYERIPDYRLRLTAAGQQQAHEAGREIQSRIGDEKVYFYVSPYRRTRQTYEGLLHTLENNQHGKVEEPRLREQDWGHLRSVEEARRIDRERDEYGPFYYRIEDGESGADVYDRVSTFLETMHRDFERPGYPPNVVIVTHGLLMRLFLMRWLHWSVDYFHQLRNPPNCFIAEMRLQPNDKYELLTTMPAVMDDRQRHDRRLYLLRLNPGGNDRVDDALATDRIMIEWDGSIDLTDAKLTRADFNEIITRRYQAPGGGKGDGGGKGEGDGTRGGHRRSASREAGCNWRFLREMQEDDLVVVPHGHHYFVARIGGPPVRDDNHEGVRAGYRRTVVWLRDAQPFERSDAGAELRRAISSGHACLNISECLPDIERLVRRT